MISHVDDSTMRSAAFAPATTPVHGWRQENDCRTVGNTGNTGNSKGWPEGPGEVVTHALYAMQQLGAAADPMGETVEWTPKVRQGKYGQFLARRGTDEATIKRDG
jgi:hypothetical protein